MSNQEELPGQVAAHAPAAGGSDENLTPVEVEQTPVEVEHAPVEVELRRSVRYGRIIIGAVVLGALIGAIASLFFPVHEGANYELGQVAGLMLVVGGAVGLILGSIFALVLGIVAGRKRGAALAVQTDVR